MYRPRAGSTDTTTHFWWVVVHDWARSLLYCKLYRRKILHSIPLKVMVPTLPPSTFQIKSAALKKKKKKSEAKCWTLCPLVRSELVLKLLFDGADRASTATDMFWKAQIALSTKKVFVDTTLRNLERVSMIDTWPLQQRNYKARHLSQLAQTHVCKQSDIIRADQEMWLTTTDLIACDVCYK